MIKKQENLDFAFKLIVLFNIVVLALVSSMYWGHIDLQLFNYPWSLKVESNWLSMYSEVKGKPNIDYPPIFPLLLGIVGKIFKVLNINNIDIGGVKEIILFLLLKIWQIIFTEFLVFFIYKKNKNFFGLILAFIISFNPVFIFNTSIWGQVDIFLFGLLIISFYYLNKNEFTKSSIFFVIGCLFKLQFLYFIPIFLTIMFFKEEKIGFVKNFILMIFIGILVWLPFMVKENNIFLPFNVYLGGFNSYPRLQMGAFNLVNVFLFSLGLQNKVSTDYVIGSITFSNVNYFILGLIVLVTLYLVFKNRNSLSQTKVNSVLFFYSLSIFMLTVSQHERYEIPSLSFIALLMMNSGIDYNSFKKLTTIFTILSFGILINHFIIYFTINNVHSIINSNISLLAFSILNSLLVIYSCFKLIKGINQKIMV